MENTQTASRSIFIQDLWTELASGVLYLSEIIWATAIFCILFNYPYQTAHIGLIFSLLGFTGYILTRILLRFNLTRNTLSIPFGIWIIAALLVTLKTIVFAGSPLNFWQIIAEPFRTLTTLPALQSQLWQLIFAVLLFQRGFTHASSSPHTWRAVRSFQLGMLMFLFYGLTTSWEHVIENLIPFLAYLLAVLVAMSASRLAELVAHQNSRLPVFKKTWFIGMLALALTTVIVGSGIGWLLGVTFVNFTAQIVNILYGIGIVILIIIFSPLIALISLLLPWLNKLIASLMSDKFGLKQLELLQSLSQPDSEKAAKFSNTLNQGIVFVLIAILLIAVISAIFGIRNRRRHNSAKINEELEDLLADPKRFGGFKFGSHFLRSRLEQARRWLAAARIRRIYQQLMEYCIKLDNPRLPSFTPLEFLPQLLLLFPEFEAELRLVTDTYMKVRYGEVPETLEEMQTIFNAWSAIKVNAELRIKERKKRLMKV